MTDTQETFRLADLTWEEAAEVFSSADFITLPCGATEQHARHLPLSVDTVRAEELTQELVTAAAEYGLTIWTLPPLPYGYSEHHMNFAGTVTLMPDTYRDLILNIGQCMKRHGAARLLLLNTHLGNESLLQLAADRLQRDHDLPTHYVSWGTFASEFLDEAFEDWGHAGPHETSVMEYYSSESVRDDRKTPPQRTQRTQTRSFSYIDEVTETGNLSDPTASDPEQIGEIIEKTTEKILNALQTDVAAERSSGANSEP